MSFIKTDNTARVFAPGYFLAADAENCTRETREMKQTDATTLSDGTKIIKMGTALYMRILTLQAAICPAQ